MTAIQRLEKWAEKDAFHDFIVAGAVHGFMAHLIQFNTGGGESRKGPIGYGKTIEEAITEAFIKTALEKPTILQPGGWQ